MDYHTRESAIFSRPILPNCTYKNNRSLNDSGCNVNDNNCFIIVLEWQFGFLVYRRLSAFGFIAGCIGVKLCLRNEHSFKI